MRTCDVQGRRDPSSAGLREPEEALMAGASTSSCAPQLARFVSACAGEGLAEGSGRLAADDDELPAVVIVTS